MSPEASSAAAMTSPTAANPPPTRISVRQTARPSPAAHTIAQKSAMPSSPPADCLVKKRQRQENAAPAKSGRAARAETTGQRAHRRAAEEDAGDEISEERVIGRGGQHHHAHHRPGEGGVAAEALPQHVVKHEREHRAARPPRRCGTRSVIAADRHDEARQDQRHRLDEAVEVAVGQPTAADQPGVVGETRRPAPA